MAPVPKKRLNRGELVDAGFAVLLTVLGLAGFRYAFGRYEYMVVGGLAAVVGAILAIAVVRLRLPALFGLAIACVGFLLFGASIAIRDHVVLGVLPTPGGVTGLIDGTMSGWRRLLTTLPPSGSLGNLLAVPFLCGYVPALVVTLLSRLTKWLGTLILLPGVVVALSVLFGDRKPFSLLVQGVLFAAASIAWMSIRRARERRVFMQTSGRKRLVGGAVMLATASLLGLIVGPRLPLAAGADRYVFDRANPPFDPQQYGSPLNGYGKYFTPQYRDKALFTVTGVPAAPGGTYGLVRLATMDDYNGVVWEVDPQGGSQSYQFLRVGETVPTDAVGAQVAVDVTVGALPGVWVPDVGTVTGITWSSPGGRGTKQRNAFRLSTYTQTAAAPVAGGLAPGDQYQVRGIITARPTDNALRASSIDASLRTKITATVPDALSSKAGEIIKGMATPYDQAAALSKWFHDNGYYTEGNEAAGQSALVPGHSAARLAAFMDNDVPVGSSEQFAAAMAIMARKVGLPARVVMGFRINGTGSVAVKGGNIDAWVEIPFVDATGVTTWVRFDPTPREKAGKPPLAQTKTPRPKFESQDVPPPPLPPPPAEVVQIQTGKKKPTKTPPKPTETVVTQPESHTLLIAAIAVGGTPLVVVGGFAGVVVLLKRRRRRRRASGSAPDRVSGGWLEFLDAARDVGLPVAGRATRREVAALLGAERAPALATAADGAIFGHAEPSTEVADDYWRRIDEARRSLREPLSLWKRLRASTSTTSLRKPT
ncbi:MAG: transglutaminase [Aeromicrobium sp.]|nr:transglutaminase [Aeromicrobium sp.]